MIRKLFHILYPKKCLNCNALIMEEMLCQSCHQLINRYKNYCDVCGSDFIGVGCSSLHVESDDKRVDRYIICYHYKNPLRDMIIRFKFNRQMYIVRAIKALLLPIIHEYKCLFSKIDYIVPMPVDRIKLADRGFNHMLEIAYLLSELINKPVNYTVLYKKAFSIPQSALPKKERHHNMEKAFFCDEIKGNILLIDDVLTTGSTIRNAGSTLKDSGADEVIALILARA